MQVDQELLIQVVAVRMVVTVNLVAPQPHWVVVVVEDMDGVIAV